MNTKNLVILIICAIFLVVLENNSLFAREPVIGQEIYKTNNVWVVRPVPLDERIVNIVNINRILSLEDYVQWLRENIKYREDGEKDYWSTPKETLQNRFGDCEDYAFLNEAVLRVFGYQPKVLAIKVRGFDHAICVFEENGYYSWIDNTELKRTETKSISEFSDYLSTQYGCSHLVTLNATYSE